MSPKSSCSGTRARPVVGRRRDCIVFRTSKVLAFDAGLSGCYLFPQPQTLGSSMARPATPRHFGVADARSNSCSETPFHNDIPLDRGFREFPRNFGLALPETPARDWSRVFLETVRRRRAECCMRGRICELKFCRHLRGHRLVSAIWADSAPTSDNLGQICQARANLADFGPC